ncbi:NADP-dependent isocitrate dehydrogenase [Hydrogenimonas thermophila]|uniref:NADP-dependent isocitrate dehydrogenase n=1 Tax=Hydrogenimonas thermophila TaxID=223786 RepID=UPI002936E527|nr:NADP-dependent isocitrate dehydrogenase [Hydrogenimonas thermophila]WOE68880.1 NADP-dependent isocitrate dehydrogenase [Hydrogenimonas thermophila]WOE71388.1 NADP-dependent isocitrate dehydrogenase [Hydrogenimonas thermophila]
MAEQKIIWTKIDEAPALATYSLFPIVKNFLKTAGVDIDQCDISLAARVISQFPERLREDQRIPDNLAALGELVKKPEANIIKLPNISASIPQLKATIEELQKKGFDLPDFPEDPQTDEEKEIAAKYATCLGSAVNPVLREGNSDRRAASAVKKFAQKNPHRLKPFSPDCKAYVAYMDSGDFYENEQSVIMDKDATLSIELNGKCLKTLEVEDKELVSSTFMSAKALRAFLAKTIEDAKEKGLLWSVHLKATMMKVSDPIIFGHAVSVFFKDVFEKYADEFEKLGVNPDLGIGDLLKKIEKSDKKDEIEAALKAVVEKGEPNIAMVDSDKGITNLHFSNDIIIDASMPPVIREGGKMWNKEGELQECVAVIPDRSYARMYSAMLEDCKENGQFDVATMGHVSNVGLMAKKAEEYGSHPFTFRCAEDGVMEVKDQDGNVLMSHKVEKGDIWRLYKAKDIAVKDWVRLAHERGKLTGDPIVFWLDSNRAHDSNLIKKVLEYLPEHLEKEPIEYHIMAPELAMKYTVKRSRAGLNTISVTGNVLRDYLTDLFPILELGTSAKMMSIVPLLAGGGLFETGAGGSAPKHVEQFLKESHLRWDSLGEFLALAESLRMIFNKTNDNKVKALCEALDKANEAYLDNNKAPGRKCGEPDNKASHFYLALYWADALANSDDKELAEKFASVAKALKENEQKILDELLAVEGKPSDIGGYFMPDDEKAEKAMRPSETLNKIIESIA